MISKEEMMPSLVEACPSFSNAWEAHKKEYHDEENFLPYAALGEFAHHLVDLYKQNDLISLESVFRQIENLHVEGDSYVREAATIGCLEGLQNVAGNSGIDPTVFCKYLGPVSAKYWDELNNFWKGVVKYRDDNVIDEWQN